MRYKQRKRFGCTILRNIFVIIIIILRLGAGTIVSLTIMCHSSAAESKYFCTIGRQACLAYWQVDMRS